MTDQAMRAKPGGRPRGIIRLALAAWAAEWAAQDEVRAMTTAELVERVPGMSARSPADVRAVRIVAQNMARAGELVRAGTRRAPATHRHHVAYLPAAGCEGGAASGERAAARLAAALSGWRR